MRHCDSELVKRMRDWQFFVSFSVLSRQMLRNLTDDLIFDWNPQNHYNKQKYMIKRKKPFFAQRREKSSTKKGGNAKKAKKMSKNRKWKIFTIFEPSTKCITVTLNCKGWMRGWHKRFACELVTIVITDTGSVDIVWLIEFQNCFECGCLVGCSVFG